MKKKKEKKKEISDRDKEENRKKKEKKTEGRRKQINSVDFSGVRMMIMSRGNRKEKEKAYRCRSSRLVR